MKISRVHIETILIAHHIPYSKILTLLIMLFLTIFFFTRESFLSSLYMNVLYTGGLFVIVKIENNENVPQ